VVKLLGGEDGGRNGLDNCLMLKRYNLEGVIWTGWMIC